MPFLEMIIDLDVLGLLYHSLLITDHNINIISVIDASGMECT